MSSNLNEIDERQSTNSNPELIAKIPPQRRMSSKKNAKDEGQRTNSNAELRVKIPSRRRMSSKKNAMYEVRSTNSKTELNVIIKKLPYEYKSPIAETISVPTKVLNVSSDRKHYQCDLCLKKFSRECLMMAHKKTHSAEKTFKCNQCSAEFIMKKMLNSHLRVHSSEIPFKSKRCAKECGTESSFECNTCARKFKTETSHSPKPFECKHCHKKFRMKYLLLNHSFIHGPKTPFRCHLCGERFNTKADWRVHVITHRQERPSNSLRRWFYRKDSVNPESQNSVGSQSMCSASSYVKLGGHSRTLRSSSPSKEKHEGRHSGGSGGIIHEWTGTSDLSIGNEGKHKGRRLGGSASVRNPVSQNSVESQSMCSASSYVKLGGHSRTLRSSSPSKEKHEGRHLRIGASSEKENERCGRFSRELTKTASGHSPGDDDTQTTRSLPFKCRQCAEGFRSKKHLILHSTTHSRECVIECNHCAEKFQTEENLRVHTITHCQARRSENHCVRKRYTRSQCHFDGQSLEGYQYKSQQESYLNQHLQIDSGEGLSKQRKSPRLMQCESIEAETGNESTLSFNNTLNGADTVTTSNFSTASQTLVENQTNFNPGESSEDYLTKLRGFPRSLRHVEQRHSTIGARIGNGMESSGKITPNSIMIFSDHSTAESLNPLLMTTQGNTVTEKYCKNGWSDTRVETAATAHETFTNQDALSISINSTRDQSNVYSHSTTTKEVKDNRKDKHSSLKTHSHDTKFKCNKCAGEFGREYDLNRHQRAHLGEKPFKCQHCAKSFKTKTELKHHLVTHSSERPFECNQCATKFKYKRSWRVHMTRHSQESLFACNLCPKTFRLKRNFEYHLAVHSAERPYKSTQCSEAVLKRCELKRQLKTHIDENLLINTGGEKHCENSRSDVSPEKATSAPEGETLTISDAIAMSIDASADSHHTHCTAKPKNVRKAHMILHSQERRFECNLCPKTYNRKHNLRRHVLRHGGKLPLKCSQCPRSFYNRPDLELHLQRHDNKFKCDQCPAKFKWQYSLNRHLRRTHSGKRFKCTRHCGKTFTTKEELTQHLLAGSSEHTFECKCCTEKFYNRHDLELHLQRHKKLKCNQCPAEFKWQYSLSRHLRRTHSGKRFKCTRHCGKTFTTKEELTQHLLAGSSEHTFECKCCTEKFKNRAAWEAHSQETVFSCNLCSNTYDKKRGLRRHLVVHSRAKSVTYMCKHCAKTFRTKSHLTSHLSTHSSERPFECTYCTTKFKHTFNLKRHLANMHSAKRSFKCSECSEAFQTGYELKIHLKIHPDEKLLIDTGGERYCRNSRPEGETLTISDAIAMSINANEDLPHVYSDLNTVTEVDVSRMHNRLPAGTNSDDKAFECNQRTAKFRRKSNLTNHLKIHTNTKPFKCSQCAKDFRTQGSLKRHLAVHSSERPFECNQCATKFKRKETWKAHMRAHNQKSIFACSLCPKTFKAKNYLKAHLVNHSNERPFECNLCVAKFKKKGGLREHMIIHSQERPFACKHCTKKFKSEDRRKKHMITHSPEGFFACSHCAKKFKSEIRQRAHIIKHSQESPFACNLCPKVFRWRGSFHRHLDIHSGEASFKCSKCLESFQTKYNLRRHLALHTDETVFQCKYCFVNFKSKRSLTVHLRACRDKRPLKHQNTLLSTQNKQK